MTIVAVDRTTWAQVNSADLRDMLVTFAGAAMGWVAI